MRFCAAFAQLLNPHYSLLLATEGFVERSFLAIDYVDDEVITVWIGASDFVGGGHA